MSGQALKPIEPFLMIGTGNLCNFPRQDNKDTENAWGNNAEFYGFWKKEKGNSSAI
jgi:hypothetical protein